MKIISIYLTIQHLDVGEHLKNYVSICCVPAHCRKKAIVSSFIETSHPPDCVQIK